jgi:predicted RecB family nuclease
VKLLTQQIRLSATDVSNHLACHHLTNLELSVARGKRLAPEWRAPDLAVIRELGLRHEAAYLELLATEGHEVLNLAKARDEAQILEDTRLAIKRGVEVIAQGALCCDRWFGRPDVLRKVEKPSQLGNWSYEVYDTKLARETKGTTMLQLAFYSELLTELQGTDPEWMWVVPPGRGFAAEAYRVTEYAAYYRYVKAQLEQNCENGNAQATYPEPCAHCDVCRWFGECDTRRREDDHLSLVAGIRRQQRNQLQEWDTGTMAKLGVLPIPVKERPKHGSREGIERVREQARVQVMGRTEKKLVYETLLSVAEGMGFCRLPEPSAGDVFLDFESDPFVGESGLQYLFGFAFKDAAGNLRYEKRWAPTNRER